MIRPIRPKPLVSVIVPPRLTYFGEDPAPAPSGGDPAPGGGGDPNADVLSFTPPDIDLAAAVLSGKEPPAGDPGAPPAAPPVKKDPPAAPPKAPPAAPPKGGTPPAGDPPAKQLREELEAVKKERDELRDKYAAGDPRLKEVEAAVKAEIAEARSKISDYERRLAMADPEVTKELTERDGSYNTVATKFYGSVPELTRDQVYDLTMELNQLPFNKPEYRAARAAFEQKVNLALGGSEEVEHRKLERALAFIEQTHEYSVERPKIVEKIEKSALDLKAKAEGDAYSKTHAAVRERLAKAKEVPEDLRAAQPYHPRVMLDAFAKSLPPEQMAAMEEGIPEYVELVAAGLRPKTSADYAGMSPAQIAEARQEEQGRLQVAKESLPDVLYQGLMALRLMPALVKDWQRLQGKVKEDLEGAPPDPSGGGDPGGGGDPNDLKNFRAPDLESLKI